MQITEDFIAAYQANYGFSEDGAAVATGEPQPEKPKEEKEEKREEEVTDSGSAKEENKKGEKRKAEPGVCIHQLCDTRSFHIAHCLSVCLYFFSSLLLYL